MNFPAKPFCIGAMAALLTSGAVQAQQACSTHVVVAGDNLRSIARSALGDADLYRVIYNANTGVIGAKADLILIGAELVIPCSPDGELPASLAGADPATIDPASTAIDPATDVGASATAEPLNPISVPLTTEVIDPAKEPVELVPELPFVIVGAPLVEAEPIADAVLEPIPEVTVAAPLPDAVVEPAPDVVDESVDEAVAEPLPEPDPLPEVEPVEIVEADPAPEPEPTPEAIVVEETAPEEPAVAEVVEDPAPEAQPEVVVEEVVVEEVVVDEVVVEEVVVEDSAVDADVASETAPAAEPVLEAAEPVAETPAEIVVAAAEPASTPPASGDVQPIRLLTGNDYAPFADEMLPGGGMVTQLVEMAIFRADPAIPYNLTFVNDWQAHIDALLPSQAYDLSFPWVRPDCEAPATLSAGDLSRCENFEFSDPLYEIVDGYFASAQSDLVAATSYSAFEGTRICRPEGYTTGVLDAAGLSVPKIELLRPLSAVDCFEALAAGKVDLVSIDAEVGDSALAELGLTGQFVQNPHLTTFLSLHVIAHKSNPRAVEMVQKLNGGIAEMYESGEWYDIVSSALSRGALQQ